MASLMYSLLAISLLRMPSHIRLMIWFSRPVSDDILAFAAGGSVGLRCTKVLSMRSVKARSKQRSPRETFLTVLAINYGAQCFNKIPFAPLRSAAS